MDLLVSNLGIPSGLTGWKVLQTKTPADFKAFTNDPVLKRTIAYFQAHAPKAASAKDLLKDPQLEDVALTAFGLTTQVGMQGLMTKVLASDVKNTNSVAAKMNDPRYRAIATAFNYGSAAVAATPAVASAATVTVTNLEAGSFASFGGTFGGVTVKKVSLSQATTPGQVAVAVQAALRRADGNRADITVTAVGSKLKFTDALGRGTAQGFTFNTGASAPTAAASSATVTLANLQIGTFKSFNGGIGGVAVKDVDLSKATTPAEIAKAVQSALRTADGNHTDITVTADGSKLTFTDALGRGTAQSLSFAADSKGPSAGTTSAGVVLQNMTTGGNFDSFSGSFGGVTVEDAGLFNAATPAQVAATLQAAFQAADGGRTDITVTASPPLIRFVDARNRGTVPSFTFKAGTDGPTAATYATTVTLDKLQAGTFASFTGRFGNVTVNNLDISADSTPTAIAAALQAAFQAADGGATSITVKADGATLEFGDLRWRSTETSFDFNTDAYHPTARMASATVAVGNLGSGAFASFSGSFANVPLKGVDLSGATSATGIAAALQAAFRAADGGGSGITVTVDGDNLVFNDALGRGTTQSFSFAAQNAGPAAAAATQLITGAPTAAQQGGPAVTNKDFIDQVVKLYTQAKFEETVGNTDSDALRQAMYAKRQLPKITNWYSVISDRPLANVVQTVLNLPDSFVKLDVDKQVTVLKAKMNIKDFTDPTKLGVLLNKFVSMSMANGTDTPASSASTQSAATMLLGNVQGGAYIGSGSAALSMLGNVTGLNTSGSGSSSLSGASLAALLLSTSQG